MECENADYLRWMVKAPILLTDKLASPLFRQAGGGEDKGAGVAAPMLFNTVGRSFILLPDSSVHSPGPGQQVYLHALGRGGHRVCPWASLKERPANGDDSPHRPFLRFRMPCIWPGVHCFPNLVEIPSKLSRSQSPVSTRPGARSSGAPWGLSPVRPGVEPVLHSSTFSAKPPMECSFFNPGGRLNCRSGTFSSRMLLYSRENCRSRHSILMGRPSFAATQ